MCAVDAAEVQAGAGLVGDRYSRRGGNRQVTLIQAESLSTIASHLGRAEAPPEDMRRNNRDAGRQPSCAEGAPGRRGQSVREYSGKRHPCSRMEEVLGVGGYSAVRGLGGMTARLMPSGISKLNDPIAILAASA